MTNSPRKTTEKQRRLSAFGISVLIHSILLLFIATLTVDLTMPEGNVTDGMEMGIIPRGSQVETVNVDVTPKSESPEMVKSKPAPPPPPPPPAPTVKEQAPPADDQGILPIKTGEESPKETPQETNPTETEQPPVTLIAPVPQQEPPQEMPEKATTTESPVPGVSPEAAAPDQSGNDAANLKGQAEVSDQSYGRADGVTDDRVLSPLVGNRRPKYPTMARFRRIEGQVEIHYEINASGQVTKIQLIGSTNEIFNDECIEALKTWRFHAPVTPGWYSHIFNFSLKGNAQELPSRLRRTQ